MENRMIGIQIIRGIANTAAAVNKTLDKKKLAKILNLFDYKTADGKDYTYPDKLVEKAIMHFATNGDTVSAENIKSVITDVDLTLLDK